MLPPGSYKACAAYLSARLVLNGMTRYADIYVITIQFKIDSSSDEGRLPCVQKCILFKKSSFPWFC